MRFSKRLLSGVALTSFLLSAPMTMADVSSSYEDSVASEEEDVMREMGELARKKVRIRKLNSFLQCATALVEHQFNGSESSIKGLTLMSTAMDRMNQENYDYKDLKKECYKEYKKYKKGVRKNTVTHDVMSQEEGEDYLTKVERTFKGKPGLVNIARKAMNPSYECRKATGTDIKVGAILAISAGWDHYTCKSPLGRKYHVFGPTLGLGMGLGVTIDTNIVDPTRFVYPMHNSNLDATGDMSESKAFLFGFGRTVDKNKDQKSSDLSIGLGVNSTKRGLMLMRLRRFPDFASSGVYSDLGVPSEVNL